MAACEQKQSYYSNESNKSYSPQAKYHLGTKYPGNRTYEKTETYSRNSPNLTDRKYSDTKTQIQSYPDSDFLHKDMSEIINNFLKSNSFSKESGTYVVLNLSAFFFRFRRDDFRALGMKTKKYLFDKYDGGRAHNYHILMRRDAILFLKVLSSLYENLCVWVSMEEETLEPILKLMFSKYGIKFNHVLSRANCTTDLDNKSNPYSTYKNYPDLVSLLGDRKYIYIGYGDNDIRNAPSLTIHKITSHFNPLNFYDDGDSSEIIDLISKLYSDFLKNTYSG